MARVELRKVYLNTMQIAILPVIAEIIEQRSQEENNNKKINVNAHIISKKTGFDYKCVKRNLLKFKELK